MIDTRYKFKNGSKARTVIKHCLIVSATLLALLVASCALIPGGTECNAVVGSFMEAGAAGDVDTAYELCIEEMTREDIENLILGQSQYFAGYEGITMKGISVEYSGERAFAEYSGEARYSGGLKMWVEAELTKVGDNWKLVSIWISSY